jgi:hypothetical protein
VPANAGPSMVSQGELKGKKKEDEEEEWAM